MEKEIKFRAWDGVKMRHFDLSDTIAPSSMDIMQYTFRKDIYGKEIYVKDILSKRWKCEVYQDCEGTFMVKFHTNPKANKPTSLREFLIKRNIAGTGYEDNIIIGNILENPELIKTKLS